MKTFEKTAAQGEIRVRRIEKLPDYVIEEKPENGVYIIGHSETGHHHVLDANPATKVYRAKNAPEGMRILYAILDEPTALIHKRSFDTHEPLLHAPGIYEYRLDREYDPYAELARAVAD